MLISRPLTLRFHGAEEVGCLYLEDRQVEGVRVDAGLLEEENRLDIRLNVTFTPSIFSSVAK